MDLSTPTAKEFSFLTASFNFLVGTVVVGIAISYYQLQFIARSHKDNSTRKEYSGSGFSVWFGFLVP